MADEAKTVLDAREEKSDEDVFLEEAKERLIDADRYEAKIRAEALDDLNVLNGDQWPAELVKDREDADRPMLTINRLAKFINQLVGDVRLNKMAIKVSARQPDTTLQTFNKGSHIARILGGLLRKIEIDNSAPTVYESIYKSAISCSFGYWRLGTRYSADDVFEQEAVIEPILNAFSVYFDPKRTRSDGRDARYVFVTDTINRDEFKELYPDIEPASMDIGGNENFFWADSDSVRHADYWVKRPFTKTLVLLSDGRTMREQQWDDIKDELKNQERIIHFAPGGPQGLPMPIEGPAPEGSGLPEQIINPAPVVERRREVESHVVAKYVIDGAQIIDGPRDDREKIILDFKSEDDVYKDDGSYRDNIWPSQYIPIIPVWGKELIIGNQRHYWSLIRFAKDAQRAYNYSRTAEIEDTALQKLPYIWMTADEYEGYEEIYNSDSNLKIGVYNGNAASRGPIFRQQFTSSPNMQNGLLAADEMKDTTSMYDPSLGQRSNETSGKAILARQREGDVANYEFLDNLRRAIQYSAEQLVEVIPTIYDTTRQIMIVGEDGKEEFVTVNQTVIDEKGKEIVANDLSVGKYHVAVSVGPSFTTQRMETAEALALLTQSEPNPVVRLILLSQAIKNMDFPGNNKITEMLENLIPPEIKDPKAGPPRPQGDPMKMLDMEKQSLKNTKLKMEIGKMQGEMAGNIAMEGM